MQTTKLSTLLSRMDANATLLATEESDKVRDLDEAIRGLKREFQTPWSLKKSTIRVFDDVLEYPVAADHDELAYIDTNPKNGSSSVFVASARFFFTSGLLVYFATSFL